MSPQIDYTKGSTRASLGRRRSAYYGPQAPHAVTECPDCGRDCDADFGNHGGDCLIGRPGTRKAT